MTLTLILYWLGGTVIGTVLGLLIGRYIVGPLLLRFFP